MSISPKIHTRFAPSPTGFLHIGSLRTALYNYLFSKHHKGKFLLRIEDTDIQRLVKGAKEDIIFHLKWMGLKFDGQPVVQSKRLKLYQKYARELIKKEKAYYCFCSQERLEKVRKEQQSRGVPPKYDGFCHNLSVEEIKEKLQKNFPYVIRLKIPSNQKIEFKDLIREEVEFDTNLIDDQVLLKSNGYPTYHLASVVDDHLMGITHVIRGEEWLPSTPKHILIYQALDWPVPEFAHLPLLLNPNRSKLSKRQGSIAIKDFIQEGYLREAILNFILLLGWNPGDEREIFSLKEMIQEFDLKKVQKGGAVFNLEKLDWLNGYYIRQKSIKELTKLCLPYFQKAKVEANFSYLQKVVKIEQTRLKKLSEIVPKTDFFFKEPKYQPELLIWKNLPPQEIQKNLKILLEKLESLPKNKFKEKDLEKEIKDLIQEKTLNTGGVLWPMRVALSGKVGSPSPFEIAPVLGKKKVIQRIKKAIEILKR